MISSTSVGTNECHAYPAPPPIHLHIQDHTSPAYIAQITALVRATNASAARLRLPFRLSIVIGAVWIPWPPAQATAMATSLAPWTLYMDLYWDFHVGGDDPATDPTAAFNFIAAVAAVFANVSASAGTPPMRGAVLEENGGRHDVQRALGHARMNNRLHCLSDVVRVATAANGLQVSRLYVYPLLSSGRCGGISADNGDTNGHTRAACACNTGRAERAYRACHFCPRLPW